MIYLESVGSFYDPKNGMIYPAFINDEPDLDCGISLEEGEVAADWWEALTPEEFDIVKVWI